MVEEKLKMKTSLEELQEEFDAFRESSAELEQELERELERLEGQARRSDARLRNAEDTKKEITGKLTREVNTQMNACSVVHWSWRRRSTRNTRTGTL